MADGDYSKHPNERSLPIPFRTALSEPFKTGQTVHVQGISQADARRIDFNFHFGSVDEGSDLPMHLSIRFDEGKIVYNSSQAGEWAVNEERATNPFTPGDQFDLRVRFLERKFQIFANRYEVAQFDQRLPLSQVSHVSLVGDLALLNLFHFGGKKYPTPFSCEAKLTPGRRLDISGIPRGGRFNVNLYRGGVGDEFAFHFSVRFDEDCVVRNATENGRQWGTEEREGGFPFAKNRVCDITIANEPYALQLFVDGARFASFAHRADPATVKTVEVDGDFDLMTMAVT